MPEAKKILIVEDEELVQSLLKKKLEGAGYEVKTASDGEQALIILNSERPDLVLMDIVLPKKSGFEIMEEMRNSDNLKGVAVMVISNSGQPVELDKARELGAVDWLIKTEFDPEEVLNKVKFHFNKPK